MIKPQDLAFILILIVLLVWKRDAKVFALAGIGALILAMPFFQFWIFFTAERLVTYAYAFLVISVTLFLFQKTK